MSMSFWLMVFAQILAATAQILLKKSAEKKYPSFIREYLNALVIGGYALLAISMVIVIFCFDGLGYMGVVIMEPIAYILVMFLSRMIFGEKITSYKIIGMLLILGGLVVFYAF